METTNSNLDWDLIFKNPEVAKHLTFQISGADLLTAIQKAAQSIQESKSVNISPEEKYMTPEQTSKMLQVSKVTLWTWNKKDILPAFKIGREVRYKLSDIQKVANKRHDSETL